MNDIMDRRTWTYHCQHCGAEFTLSPNRTYLVCPLECEPCEKRMQDAVGVAFDAATLFGTPAAVVPECFRP